MNKDIHGGGAGKANVRNYVVPKLTQIFTNVIPAMSWNLAGSHTSWQSLRKPTTLVIKKWPWGPWHPLLTCANLFVCSKICTNFFCTNLYKNPFTWILDIFTLYPLGIPRDNPVSYLSSQGENEHERMVDMLTPPARVTNHHQVGTLIPAQLPKTSVPRRRESEPFSPTAS